MMAADLKFECKYSPIGFGLVLMVFLICNLILLPRGKASILCTSNRTHSASCQPIDNTLVQAVANDTTQRMFNPQSVVLSVSPFQSRIAQLSWTNSISVTSGTYLIQRQDVGTSAWTNIQQLPYTTLSYNDTISHPYCSPTNFLYKVCYVSLIPDTTCSNAFPVNQLSDQTNPPNVQNVSVGINSAGHPELTWTPVPGNDIAGYIIARNNTNGFGWINIDTVPAIDHIYVDTNVKGQCDTIYKYVILTLDRCDNNSAPVYNSVYVQTIILTIPDINPCERQAKLTWNPYLLIPGGLGGYKIYRTIDSGLPVEIADTLATSFTDTFQYENGHVYHYFVQAYSLNGVTTSSSCQWPRIFLGPNAPDSIYLAQVSVQSDNYIELKYHSLPPNTVKKIVLERSVNPGAGFQAIDSISTQNGFLPSDYLLNDSTADVHNQSYYYRLIAIDSCGTIKKYSNIGRSILLHCVEDQTDNQLSWNAYETWLEGVDNYKAFRTINGQPTAGELIVTQSSWILTYSDPLTTIDPNKSLCYWIEANENAGNPYLNNAISLSNTCCIIKEGTLFMPNAFCPDGINYRFRPVTTFIDPLSFNLTIFNRFGQQIFETSDMSEGWNGMVSGQPAPLGLYVYLVSYKSATGKEYTKRSSVFLVR